MPLKLAKLARFSYHWCRYSPLAI